ncbi:efflux RND transporter permease subunit [Oceanicella sp. SM1341]|uniref:efflux RND transporter permease subunit n=1 Tax=Oceanicella sp. SM1341 TaxID=1548889 RepID=UPI000E52DC66|nr:efflux RND transporter permease subunit [Oceanicella sp. SM1341]
MTGLVDWAASRARMIVAFILLTIGAGSLAYVGLPKEGEPDIDIPMLFVSVPFPGISAEDAEKLIIRPLETKLRDVEGLDKMTATAVENYAYVMLQFEFGWDKTATLAEVRDRVSQAETEFPDGADATNILEINFSEFPILVISLSGDVPERTLFRLAKDMQTGIEGLPPVLEAGLAGYRDEMLEVLIDPLKLESYNVTADELIEAVTRNNQLVAAGEVETGSGAYSVKIPSSFESPADIYAIPVKVNGDRVVTLADLTDIRLSFEDAEGTARFNGKPTVSLQIVKRKGENLIDTVAEVKAKTAEMMAAWPPEMRQAVTVAWSMDDSTRVGDMVTQLESSVLTAIALVMIVVLASLGLRSALLVGVAIPVSFLLTFAGLAVFGMSISNIVMFGLILAVGMLVDGAIVVVEYADTRISEGQGPMRAFTEAAKRMFWPIISSTATTLCAFLPMLFWPGIPGEFMGNLPVTLIFVLSASLVVALIYLPVMGGVAGRISRTLEGMSEGLRARAPLVLRLAALLVAAAAMVFALLGLARGEMPAGPGLVLFVAGCLGVAVSGGSLRARAGLAPPAPAYRRSAFGHAVHFLTANPVMPFVAIGAAVLMMAGTVSYFSTHSKGVEFFVETEPERAVAYVRARGNLSLEEKDRLVRLAEGAIEGVDGVQSVFAFAGNGGLNQDRSGGESPADAVGQVQIELAPWNTRRPGREILADINARLAAIPGILSEISEQEMGPASGKPVHLRLMGDRLEDIAEAVRVIEARMRERPGLVGIDDTRPLPGIDWQIDVDVEQAGRYGADVTTVGIMVQLVTQGLLLDTMRTETSDEEVEIRVRFPEDQRLLSTLDGLRVRTEAGLVPLSNFISREPVQKLGQIDRYNTRRYFDVKADIAEGANANAEIDALTDWLTEARPLPDGITWEWTGDREEQEESQAFLGRAFLGALGLMFVILLAQFNSFYNSVLVLTAVVMSVTGVLIGMLVMDQAFSIIMTGTGIVALAGIVVNNNIVLIDTFQEFSRQMPVLEAITRTAEARIRPVLLTTITTMAGLMPMMFGMSVDFAHGGYSVDAPSSMMWKQLATAVVFGLGTATVLTLIVTPAALAARYWVGRGAGRLFGRMPAEERALRRRAAGAPAGDIIWPDTPRPAPGRLDAAE